LPKRQKKDEYSEWYFGKEKEIAGKFKSKLKAARYDADKYAIVQGARAEAYRRLDERAIPRILKASKRI